MRKVLVLNLSRMGDLIQSVPFLTALSHREDVSEIHLLVEKAFAPVANLLPRCDGVHILSHDELLPPLSQTSQTNALALYHLYQENLRDLQQEHFDEVWNLTHTRPSMVVTRLLGGENGRGVTMDSRGLQMVRSPWLRYFFATNLARPYCQFNLVDIYAQCAGPTKERNNLELIPDASGEAFADNYFSERKLTPKEPIAFQLGAAHYSKRWPAEKFVALAKFIQERFQRPVILLGHSSESELAIPFEGIPGVFSLVGQTTIPQLFSILRRCRVLVSNDTGTIHLAAGAKLPVLAVTLGTALGSETAPYGAGNIVVEPDTPCFPCSYQRNCLTKHCHDAVTPQTVFEILGWMIKGQERSSLRSDFPYVRVYETDFNAQDQMLELKLLSPATPPLRDQLHAVVRPLWRRVLGVGEELTPAETIESTTETNHMTTLAHRALHLVRRALSEMEKMQIFSRENPQPMERLWQSGETLTEIDKALDIELNSHALLRSFGRFSSLTKASLEGSSLEEQVDETLRSYIDLEFLLQGLTNSLQPTREHFPKKKSRKEDWHESVLERT